MVAAKVKNSKTYSKTLPMCSKCGSSMIERMLALKNSEQFKLVKISQCKVCRHWRKL